MRNGHLKEKIHSFPSISNKEFPFFHTHPNLFSLDDILKQVIDDTPQAELE